MDIQLKKGILDLCVLYAISNNESYGYKIIIDLKEIIDISESTLYPILKRLGTGGYLTTKSIEYNGRIRHYYAITEAGIVKLKDGIDDLKKLNEIYKKIGGKYDL